MLPLLALVTLAATTHLAWLEDLADLVDGIGGMSKATDGCQFVEGPAWHPLDKYLVFSDIPADTIFRYDTRSERATPGAAEYRKPSGNSNGLMFDRRGDLYLCQGGLRRVLRITREGEEQVLADSFDGKPLNSPNDLALDGSGGLYFTDPRYGDASNVEQDVMGVYYVAADGSMTRVVDSLQRPNGILVAKGRTTEEEKKEPRNPGEQEQKQKENNPDWLLVADPELARILRYPILGPGRLGAGEVFFTGDATLDGRGPDGMALDERGNLYATYQGIVVLDPEGGVIGRIPVPERPANCTFGGTFEGNALYITARTSVYVLDMKVGGAAAMRGVPRPGEGSSSSTAPVFRRVEVDSNVAIGYGVAVADMDGDDKPDLVLADKQEFSWYRNPDWKKFELSGALTPHDHVCIAARDLDGDSRAEIAVGAGWNPSDTENSGSVHLLMPGADRSQSFNASALPHEPTTHRMRWIRGRGDAYSLAVLPLHGRGNTSGRGAGVRFLEYRGPLGSPQDWSTRSIEPAPDAHASDGLHVTHNFDPVQWDEDPEEELLVAAREGLFLLDLQESGWQRRALIDSHTEGFLGASEVRLGTLQDGGRFLATVEPFHGHQLIVYSYGSESGAPRRAVVDDSFAQAHAVACGDLLGRGSSQIVVGWRRPDRDGKVGIRLFAQKPGDPGETSWEAYLIDDNSMATEDLRIADLDGDGDLDIVAAGRDTHNLCIYFNQRQPGS